MRLLLLFTLFTSLTFGQDKPILFYTENGKQVSKQEFFKTRDHNNNLDLYFENDTTQLGILIARQKFGQLDKSTFNNLKDYLSELTSKSIDSSQNIVINYLTVYPSKKDVKTEQSNWNVLDNDYTRKLHKVANINQFWINSPECDNLNYYRQKKINWIADTENLLKKIFFPYEIENGHYVLIKPDGRFYYYLGEHSKYNIWENAEKFF